MANLEKCIDCFLQYISLDVFYHLAQAPQLGQTSFSGLLFVRWVGFSHVFLQTCLVLQRSFLIHHSWPRSEWKSSQTISCCCLFWFLRHFQWISPDLPCARKAFSHASQLARYECSFWQEPRYTDDKTGIQAILQQRHWRLTK